MVPILEIWLPILLAASLVFVASSVIHMALGYHASDHAAVPAEERVRAALREAGIQPGDYAMPRAGSMKDMSDPAFLEKMKEGPVAVLTVRRAGPPAIGATLGKWFVYLVAVSLVVAYVTGRSLGPGTEYLRVFQVAGAVAFLGYAAAPWPDSIWFGRKWSTALKCAVDGLVYALLTAGAFAWLWP
jgi:hypothetical protein